MGTNVDRNENVVRIGVSEVTASRLSKINYIKVHDNIDMTQEIRATILKNSRVLYLFKSSTGSRSVQRLTKLVINKTIT